MTSYGSLQDGVAAAPVAAARPPPRTMMRRATAAATEAYVRELVERGLGEEDSELLEARAAAAAARDRTPAVYHRRRVERLLAEGMEAKEKYDSLVARGVRGAAAERAFGVMCRALRRTENGRRRLAACMDAAAARASPRQLESEFRTSLDACKAALRPVFEQTTLPVYLGLAGDPWWEDEVRRVALRSSSGCTYCGRAGSVVVEWVTSTSTSDGSSSERAPITNTTIPTTAAAIHNFRVRACKCLACLSSSCRSVVAPLYAGSGWRRCCMVRCACLTGVYPCKAATNRFLARCPGARFQVGGAVRAWGGFSGGAAFRRWAVLSK